MDHQSYKKLKSIWNQQDIPVIFRPGSKDKLKAKIPFFKGNRSWLKYGHRIEPIWNKEKKHWVIPNSWFNDIVNKSINKYGKVYVIQPYRAQEKCAPACWNAKGHECNCSCMGENHGTGGSNSDWLIISDAFATKWGEKEYACRLLSNKKHT
ncbi:MAG: hypothetical protein QM504_02950 [Pseudomonadota bacterium]